jgi:thioredoxin-disulfide reductase
MAMKIYDTIIIGAGPAGLSAALYTTRRTLSTLVLTKDIGGQTALTDRLENYPGVDFSTGPDLMNAFADQAKKFGATILFEAANGIKVLSDGTFEISTEMDTSYIGRTVILASGKHHRKLNVPGEEEFMNRGVVYCATCDAPLFEGKSVAVVGGGSAAFDAALLLAKIASGVYLIHRRSEFRAEPILVERAKKEPKIKFILDSQVQSITGEGLVSGIVVDTPEGVRNIAVEGVFVEVGQVVETQYLAGLAELSDKGEIVVTPTKATSQPGLFAAGDITTVPYKQTVICAGDGAIAALSAYDYLQGIGK